MVRVVILGQDVARVRLGERLEDGALGHQSAGVYKLLQNTRVRLLR